VLLGTVDTRMLHPCFIPFNNWVHIQKVCTHTLISNWEYNLYVYCTLSTRLVDNHGAQIWQDVIQKDIEITLKASSSVRSSPIYTGSTSFGFAIPAICIPLAFRHVLFYLFVPLPRLPSSLPCQVMNCMCIK
jgi:hypothetical protein